MPPLTNQLNRALILLFICVSVVHAQTNQEKPKWVDKIPERNDAPTIDVDYQPDTELDINAQDLGMDRDALFEDEEQPVEMVEDKITIPDVDEAAQEQKAQEAAKIAQEQKAAQEALEQKAADEAAEQQRLTEQRLAEQRQKELDEQAEQKRINDELVAKRLAEDLAAQASSEGSGYAWKRIKNVLPEYPAKAVRNRDEGWVSVRVEIDIYGDVVAAKVVDTYRNLNIFNKAALKAVRQWKFDPPVNYGIESNQTKDVKITFEL